MREVQRVLVPRLLLGLYVPDAGDQGWWCVVCMCVCMCVHQNLVDDAYFDGRWFGDWPSLQSMRHAIGYVPQQPVLFDQTLMENVLYGQPSSCCSATTVRERASALLAEVGFPPERWHQRVGKGGLALSGGQRQIVWCIRVLLQNPLVLLMDEPTASMDQASAAVLLRLLDRLMDNRTVVFASHDPNLLGFATHSVPVGSSSTSNV